MDTNKSYEILKEIVEGMAERGEIVKRLPPDIQPDKTLDELGIDLIAFSDIAEEFRRRFDGRQFQFDSFMLPQEYFYVTIGRFLDSVAISTRPTTKNPEVVYVDDEEENIFLMKRKFGKELNLKTFTEPLLALAYVRSNTNVALVITDEVMPKLSGNELCDEVRKTHPNIKFILVTGNPNSDEDLMYRSLRLSRFYEFLNKPLDFDNKGGEYLKTIQSALE